MMFFLSSHGRLSRRGFWLGFVLVFALVTVAAFFLDEHLTRAGPLRLAPPFDGFAWAMEMIGGPAQTAVLLVTPFSASAMLIKRLHDTGHGALMLWWKIAASIALGWLISDAPTLAAETGEPEWAGTALSIAAGVAMALLWGRVLVLVGAIAGEVGDNRFGPDPLAR